MSVKLNVDIRWLKELVGKTRKFDMVLEDYLNMQLYKWANIVREEAERVVPVRTGYLRSTIYATVKDLVVNVGAYAAYALFVERGTQKMRAQPFIEPSIKKHLVTLEGMIESAIKRAQNEVGFR